MKNLLRRWLLGRQLSEIDERFYDMGTDFMRADDDADALKTRVSSLEIELREHSQVIEALLEHHNLKATKEMEPDPAYVPPEPRMRQVARIHKHK